jgi:hypothetical protein
MIERESVIQAVDLNFYDSSATTFLLFAGYKRVLSSFRAISMGVFTPQLDHRCNRTKHATLNELDVPCKLIH